MFFARYEASNFGILSIETEHLLLGLLREDRVLLSKFIALESFGFYMLAVLLVSGLQVVIGPAFNVIYPKFTTLLARDDRPTLAELDRRYIQLILAETDGNKSRAAEILGIDRRTIYRYLDPIGQPYSNDPE